MPLAQVARLSDREGVNLHDWIDELCDALDVEVDLDEALILDVARDAATYVDLSASPLTAFLLGYAAAASNGDPDEMERLAAIAMGLAQRWDKTPTDLAHEDDDPEIEEELESVDA
jgi:hypothetical protein